MERIVFLERNTFSVEFRRPRFPHEWIEFPETQAGEVVERLRDATVVVANKLALREPELSQLPNLKLIAIAATGTDNVDLNYCRAHSIAVCNTRNYAGHSLAEHVLLLMLALRRNLFGFHEAVERGDWQRSKQFCLLSYPIHDLYGTTLGVIGFGFLGQSVARLAEAIGMKVIVAERKDAEVVRGGRISFNDTLGSSDVITLHVPLYPETRDMIAEPELRLMKSSALLINTARGALVNENDLLRALRERRIAAAGIDVLRQEPPPAGDVLLNADLDNLIVTPHVAWSSREAMQSLADQVVENIEAFVDGHVVNRIV